MVNKALQTITGFSEDQLLNKKYTDLIDLEDKAAALTLIYKTKKAGSVEDTKNTLITNDKTKINVNVSASFMPDKQRLMLSIKNIG